MPAAPPPDLVARLAEIVGARNVLTAEFDKAPYLTELRGYYLGRTPAVVKPGSAEEISAIVKLANETGTPIVPQGGNTGLVGGQTPDESGREVVLSLERLDKIRAIDAEGGTIVAEAGVVLERLQEAAAEAGMLFPLSLGAQGSCRIGGNISTNAGGTAVLAYGNTRSLVLGLEVVLPTGEIWNGLRGLVKDNSGYDLKQLFIGAEGTLGIVTAAVLKLFPRPRGQAVAFAGVADPAAALKLFRHARESGRQRAHRLRADAALPDRAAARPSSGRARSAREPASLVRADGDLLRPRRCRRARARRARARGGAGGGERRSTRRSPLRSTRRSSSGACATPRAKCRNMPAARSSTTSRSRSSACRISSRAASRRWKRRCRASGRCRSAISATATSTSIFRSRREWTPKAFRARAPEIHAIVHALVAEMDGSIAAEHGIGRYKRELLKGVKSEVELEMMRKIKRAFDPNNILNPGRVI